MLAAVAAVSLFPATFSAKAAEPDPKAITYTLPDKIEWKKGAASDSAVLQGDDKKPGVYVQLLRWHPNNMSRPHSHDTARYIYVVSGTWWVGTGDKFDPDSTKPLPAGSYVMDIPNELHYDGAKDQECVLMIVGTGPMKTTSPKPFQAGSIKK
ncbi:MAG TPA: cupin domain-containing protein [Bryobacteraceae bacterium]|jgi:quercetin dioxygenase-like cupin family protein|nr:cupin domain-containing protein [Bryobacteraceae bacterium]